MASPEILGRLSAGAVDPLRVRGSHHGGLTASDIAAAMSGMTRLSAILLLTKYAQQIEHISELRRVVLLELSKIAGSWPFVRAGFLTDMISLAIWEHLGAGLCASCAGRGYRPNGEGLGGEIKCKSCRGTGRGGKSSDDHYERVLGLREHQWRRRWRSNYEEIKYILSDAEQRGLAVVTRRLQRT